MDCLAFGLSVRISNGALEEEFKELASTRDLPVPMLTVRLPAAGATFATIDRLVQVDECDWLRYRINSPEA